MVVCVLDRSGRLARVNRAAEEFFGWSATELRERRFFELVKPEDRERMARILAPSTENDGTFETVRCRHSGGGVRSLEWTVLDADGSPWVILLGRDVTEDRAVRAELNAAIGLLQDALRQRTLDLARARTELEDLRNAKESLPSRRRTGEGVSTREAPDDAPEDSPPADGTDLVDASSEADPGADLLPGTADRLFHRAPFGILRITPDQRIVAANRAARELLGADSDREVLGSRSSLEVFSDPATFRLLQDRLRVDGEVRSMKVRLRHPTVGRTRVLLDACRVRTDRGQHRFDELFLRPLGSAPASGSVPEPDSFRTGGDVRRERGAPDRHRGFPRA